MKKDIQWDEEVEVAVVGFGAAGACAALEALQSGASVAVLDRFEGGGATAISGGIVYAGGGTHIQQEAGVSDTIDDMLSYLRLEVKDAVKESTLRDFCESSADNLKWLEGHGVPFDSTLCPYKTSYPLDHFGLYYSGNEPALPYREHASPAPRGHRVQGKGMPGQRFFSPLKQAARALGASLHLHSRVTTLHTDSSGAVIGLSAHRLKPGGVAAFLHRWCEKIALKINNYSPGLGKRLRRWNDSLEATQGRPFHLRATQGIVLTAGGFIYNRAMVREVALPYRPGMPLGTTGCDGSGITLGQSVDGGTSRMDRISAWRFINPPKAFTHGILLNRKGERYINEELYGATIGEAMVEENRGEGILIIDDALRQRARGQIGRGKTQWFQTAPTLLNLWFNARRADSIPELAGLFGMDESTLEQTLHHYNRCGTEGTPDPLGKSKEGMHNLSPPYFAINCSLNSKRFPCPTLTLGGLVVNERTGQVVSTAGTPIPGLYAAGRNAVGICSQQYVSGLSIADCVYSGRRAGRSCAVEKKKSSDSRTA